MSRNIWVYGNPDKTHLGFKSPDDLTRYLKGGVFSKEHGRYRYTVGKDADVIVLSRDGLAYGHFDVDAKVKPTAFDRQEYPPVRFVYLVRKSWLYHTPVLLASLSITKIRFGRRLSEDEFRLLQERAGGITEYGGVTSLPDSPLELERVLREVRQRMGQSEFRDRVVAAYGTRCAITRCDALEAMEAAHIDPYCGPRSNQTSNGILLRADVHALFDQDLIAIEPESMTVILSSSLKCSTYQSMQERQLKLPSDPDDRPNLDALATRWKRFVDKNS